MTIIKEFSRFIKHVLENKNILLTLAVDDFKQQYLGSYLGIFWAILRPGLFILTIWFIFSIGFKKGLGNNDVPFVIFLLTGYIPWFFFSEAVVGGMNSIITNKFLVKKVAFRVSILPIVKIISAFFLHIIFIGILILMLFIYGFTPTLYWLQLPYYTLCLILLLLGISWLTASLRVFIKDIAQIVSVVLQLGFWITPIFWSLKMVPDKYLFLIQLNPLVYIIEGYRDTFINQKWFWEKIQLLPYFFLTTIFFLIVGSVVFKRLRPHFGDVL